MEEGITLKIFHGSDIRRYVAALTSTELSSYKGLVSTLQEFFGPGGYSIQYSDPDGDVISIGTTLQLEEAIRSARNSQGSVLRLNVAKVTEEIPIAITQSGISTETSPPASNSTETPAPSSQATSSASSSPIDCIPEKLQALLGGSINNSQMLKTFSQILLQPHVSVMLPQLMSLAPVFLNHLSATASSVNVNEILTNISSNPQTQQQCQSLMQMVSSLASSMTSSAGSSTTASSVSAPDSTNKGSPAAANNSHNSWTVLSPVAPNEPLLVEFVSHLTIPETSEMAVGTPFIKSWKVRNCGSADWPAGTKLVFLQGEPMTTESDREVHVGWVEAKSEIEVHLPMIAPAHEGKFVSYWRLATGDGTPFGQPIWCSLVTTPALVPVPAAPAAVSSPTLDSPVPTSTSSLESVSSANTTPTTTKTTTAVSPSAHQQELTSSSLSPSIALTEAQLEIAKVQRQKWEHLLDNLEQMGFSDRQKNTRLLLKNSGNIDLTIQDLIEDSE